MSSSEVTFVKQVLRAHDASGERLAARLRIGAALIAVVVALFGASTNTAECNAVLTSSVLLYLGYALIWLFWVVRTKDFASWLSFLSVAIDLTFCNAVFIASLLNHSGPYEVYRSPALWLALAAANALTTLRGNLRVCWFSCALTLLYGIGMFTFIHFNYVLPWVPHARYVGEGLNWFEVFQAHLFVLAPGAIAARVARRSAHLALESARREQERAQLEWRLKVSDRMVTVGTMAAGVAHEMSNPLTYVIHNLDIATRRAQRDAKHSELAPYLERASSGTQRVHEIMAALRTFSRIDEGPKQPVDLRTTLDAALTMASSEVKHRARVDIEQDDTISVLGNQAKLGQVFLNLIVNAAQAINEPDPRKHTIRIVISRQGGRALIEISDTGSGIAPDHLDRIFEPFFTTKPVGTGTGLGLSICQSILQELSGTIAVESQLGVGTTFRITLPSTDQPAWRTSSVRPIAPHQVGRVLVIDDDRLVSETVELMLAEEHDVVLARDAEEALGLLANGERFDAILCDLTMPGMSGAELHRKLTSSDPSLAQRMLFATGGVTGRSAHTFVQHMGTRVITKPFRSEELRSKVHKLVSTSLGSMPRSESG